jgi:hypothetical protein
MQRWPIRTALLVVTGCLALASIGCAASQSGTAQGPVLRTQQFESGELSLATVESCQLETFLQDLNRRKDFDMKCHDGKVGPDGEYLAKWVRSVTDELLARGYSFDHQGNLHRPGVVVSVR